MTAPVPFAWARGYRRAWLRRDVLAGATAAAVVIPQAMAYASIATVPLEAGIACALLPPLAYAALGTSRALSVSTTSSVALLTAGVIASEAGRSPADTAATLALLAGAILFGAGLARLGFLADFVSVPVLTGFKTGMGLLIIAGQLGKLLGVPVEGDAFFDQLASALGRLGDTDLAALALGAATIALILAVQRWSPRLPGPLIGLAAGIIIVALVAPAVALVDPVPQGLPALSAPSLDGAGALLPGAAGIALIALVESSAAGRAFRRRDDPPLDLDRELLAVGAANLAGSVSGALPSSGGLSQSAVADRAGARSPAAGVVVAIAAALTLLVLAPVFDDLAQATLGALVVVAAYGLIDVAGLARIRRLRTRDFALAVVALAGVLVFGSLPGVLTGVLLSVLVVFYESNRPPLVQLGRKRSTGELRDLADHPGDEPVAELLILRPVGTIYFANARRVLDRQLEILDRHEQPLRVLLLDCSAIADADVTAVDLVETLRAELADRGLELWVSGLDGRLLEMARRASLLERVRADGRLFDSAEKAVERFEQIRAV
jgi:sulfate permease, SulP family